MVGLPFDFLDTLARRMAELNIEPEAVAEQVVPQVKLASLLPSKNGPLVKSGAPPMASGTSPIMRGNSQRGEQMVQPSVPQAQQAPQASPREALQMLLPQAAPMSQRVEEAGQGGMPGISMAGLPQEAGGITGGIPAVPTLGSLLAGRTAPGAGGTNVLPNAPLGAGGTDVLSGVPSGQVPYRPGPTPGLAGGDVAVRPEGSGSGGLPQLSGDANSVRQAAINAWRTGGVSNPFGLAALVATGTHESKFDPGNLTRSWSDPSESGEAGTSGGMFSWRGPRLKALDAFSSSRGDTGHGSPTSQALFYIHERPQVIAQLNQAQSVEEAMQIINSDIAFAGYNREGGEAGRRLQTARVALPEVQTIMGQAPTPLDDTAGATPPEGIDATATAAAPTKADTFADRLAKIGQAIKPETFAPPKPPDVSTPNVNQGAYNRAGTPIEMILQMMGGGMGAVPQTTPTLGQMLGGRR